MSSVTIVQCCFTSTETIRLSRDGEPRTTISTFTRLMSSDNDTDKALMHKEQINLSYRRMCVIPVSERVGKSGSRSG